MSKSLVGKVSSIAFDAERYDNNEAMWADVTRLLQILTKNDCSAAIHTELNGEIVVVDFAVTNCEYSEVTLDWLTDDELYNVYEGRTNSKEDNDDDE